MIKDYPKDTREVVTLIGELTIPVENIYTGKNELQNGNEILIIGYDNYGKPKVITGKDVKIK